VIRDQRSLTATVIAIVSPGVLAETAGTLASLSRGAGVRPVIISIGDDPEAPRRDEDGATVIEGLLPRYLDKAVASVRLSSLPAAAWWRAGDPRTLRDLAALVDRVVLDLEDPAEAWTMVPAIARLAPVSDIRWARLTRWRDLVAQFFDVPDVREATYDRLAIAGADVHDAALLAGWLKSRLPGGRGIDVVHDRRGGARLGAVELSGPAGRLAVRLLPNGTCLETLVDLHEGPATSRVVARGDDHLAALLGEELRVRSRDLAFEDAVRGTERS
jgi:hypothetical protein